MTLFTPAITARSIIGNATLITGYLIDPALVERVLGGDDEGWDEAVEKVLKAAVDLGIDAPGQLGLCIFREGEPNECRQ